jgi:hypothetical protein
MTGPTISNRLGAALLATCILVPSASLASNVNDAQNRCLVYGFKKQKHIAECTEVEMRYDKPKKWKFSDIDKVQSECMVIGYRDDDLARCVMRRKRNLK